ncbi:MAG TPA: YraN family protein [Elusimicrobiota bacterium]|nr:YraN family protein [Elusimicrobiota bacterium]
MNRQEAGAQAEEAAARFLESRGLRIVEKNFRCKMGEIDLIAEDGEALVFVEVRSRASSSFGTAAETIGFAKRRKIIKTALFYLQSRGISDRAARFDAVTFDGGALSHIPGAFSADGGF